MDKENIISKIKKCLALAKSDNPHEAASALRQAQKLMEMHNISDIDVQVSDVYETKAKAATVEAVRWESMLAHLIAEAFGCSMYVSNGYELKNNYQHRRTRDYCFIGVSPSADIAQYAFEVLSAQCAKARRRYISSQRKNCKASTKTARGDLFAEGYVRGLHNLVQKFAVPEGTKELISHYIEQHHSDFGQEKPKDRVSGKNITHRDHAIGMAEAKNAQLHHGVGTAGKPQGLLS